MGRRRRRSDSRKSGRSIRGVARSNDYSEDSCSRVGVHVQRQRGSVRRCGLRPTLGGARWGWSQAPRVFSRRVPRAIPRGLGHGHRPRADQRPRRYSSATSYRSGKPIKTGCRRLTDVRTACRTRGTYAETEPLNGKGHAEERDNDATRGNIQKRGCCSSKRRHPRQRKNQTP